MWYIVLIILLLVAMNCFIRHETFDGVKMIWKKNMDPPYTTVMGNTMYLFNPELYNS